jgi:hypothetical protein
MDQLLEKEVIPFLNTNPSTIDKNSTQRNGVKRVSQRLFNNSL